MSGDGVLVHRDRELALLDQALAGLAQARGGTVLLSGEAGVGKTSLVEAALAAATVRVLRGAGYPGAMSPYEPLGLLLREHLPGSMGEDARQVVIEALRSTVGREPTVVFLDDLHWADAATLELLGRWAPTLADVPVLLVAAYRSDGLPRRHPLRRLRAQLRRGALLVELEVAPLDEAGTALLVGQRLGETVPAELARAIHERTQGVPFYIEALADMVRSGFAGTVEGSDLEAAASVIPDRIRDAMLLRLELLTPDAVELAEVVAAAGMRVPMQIVAEFAATTTVDELLDSGLVEEVSDPSGQVEATFRHSLMREAVYSATPWTRRRAHHLRLAEALEASHAPPQAVAAQLLAAGDAARARPWLVSAAKAACAVHAYQDARTAIRTALESWSTGEDPGGQLGALELWAQCAERIGELDDAVAALRAIADAHGDVDDDGSTGEVERRLAGVHELRGDVAAALAARAAAVEAFDRAGRSRDAAAERLAMAEHLDGAGQLSESLALIEAAAGQLPSDDVPLRARALGLEGLVRSGLGEGQRGVGLARQGLDLALEAGQHEVSADAYYLWAVALEYASRAPEALDAYSTAFDYCESHGADATAQLCLACLAPSLRRTGLWQQAIDVCRDVIANPAAAEPARVVARSELGLMLAARGETKPARRQLTTAFAFAETYGLFGAEIDATWGLARVEEAEGRASVAAQRLSQLVNRCAEREERHFALGPLRWAGSFFAQQGLRAELAACTDALSDFAGATGAPEALAATASVLAESALLDGDGRRAADGFERALELLAPLDLPADKAEIAVRAGTALALAGAHDQAVERLVGGYHTARKLGARPLAMAAARQLAALGEDVERRLGRRAARHVQNEGLTRRELEVLRLVAQGHTNREIGQELFVSTRTVDMHVRNLLGKLGCRTRAEAVSRATELDLLPGSRPSQLR